MDAGEPVSFQKGTKLIEQDAPDDCVYFMLSGKVEVRKSGQHIDFREAPDVVGELAAKRAGTPRTADVIVHSERLDTLVLSGTQFRKLIDEFPTFKTNLDEAVENLAHQKISQLGERSNKQPGEPAKRDRSAWTKLSVGAGVAASLAAGLIAWLAGVTAFEIALAGLSIGFLVFVCMLLANPLLRYRNMSSAAGYALIGMTLYGSLSFVLTIDGKEIDLPLIDFSVDTEIRLGALLICCIALLGVTWIGGWLDLNLGKARED
jgi:CRP-like cAMP-binding protein